MSKYGIPLGIKRNLWASLLAFGTICAGCMPGTSCDSPKTSADSSKNEEQHTDVRPELPAGDILTAHTQALRKLTDIKAHDGIKPPFDDCLDHASSLYEAWFKAISKRTDGAWLLLALRMAEADKDQIPPALQMIEHLQKKDTSKAFEDIFEYYKGQMWLKHAESLAGIEAHDAYEHAIAAFDKVIGMRKSPYYHLARAEKLKTAMRLGLDVTSELDYFIRTYPDYPGLLSFKLEFAKRQYHAGKTDEAIQTLQDLAFYETWSPVSAEAQKWLHEKGIADRERTFKEEFSKVDKLRKARFWDEAEIAAVAAMAKYPESYQLMVQHARIAYERSHHDEAARRFEKILEKLDGQEKDNLKPRGVIAYLYRAYGYMGDCTKALEYHARNAEKLGRKARKQATMEFAQFCGALDISYENAKEVYAGASGAQDLANFGFIAYLSKDYAAAREKFARALESLSGTYKRRISYFYAQATLKVAQAEVKAAENAATSQNNSNTTETVAQNSKTKPQKKKRSKSKKNKTFVLPAATLERAKSQFKAIIQDDNDDYYAILAHTRLAELERGNAAAPATPVIQTFGAFEQDPLPPRPWNQEFTFDEKALLEDFAQNVEKYRHLFPELERVAFFHDAELYRERNAAFRPIAIEAMGITRLARRPVAKNLWSTSLSFDGHIVDNRKKDTGFWGNELTLYRFELPPKAHKTAREEMAERQGAIYDAGASLRTFIKNTLIGFHDYYLARRYTPAPKKTCGSPQNLDQCATLYPHAYAEDVIKAAHDNQITPDIIWAVMNIESAFNPDSISHADAYGLLQIIPMTGYKIADALQDTDFGPYDLIRPEASITMGTWYFAQILHKFQGYATLSMAGYNGGPHQVARWLTAWGDKIEHDAFVELIPYNEARNYVKKGMARLLIFHRIDQHDPNAFFEIPNTLPQKVEIMANY